MVRINSTKFGEIAVDGKTYFSDMVVWWDGKVEFRDKAHTFSISEFMAIAKGKPEIVVVGTGQQGVVRVPQEVHDQAEILDIQIFIETSPRAIELFNAFNSEKKRVVAVIHTTC